MCRKRYKEFQFWLFNDQLCYGEKTPLGLYTLNRQISLDRCYIQELPADAANAAESFIVLSPAKTFQVKTRSAAERRDWTDAIQLHIAKTRELRQQQQQREQHEGGGGGVGELAAIAPLWKPDTNSPDCELCGTVFTLLYRRHHCRHCGVVVCDGCSSKRFKLPHVDSRRPVRVCDRCFTTLAGSGKRPSLYAQSSTRTVGSDDDDASDGGDDDDVDLERRGDVDENELDEFNDWEEEQRRTGSAMTATATSSAPRSENERIATLVTAPMMKMSAALGENIRRFARTSMTAFSPLGSPSAHPTAATTTAAAPSSSTSSSSSPSSAAAASQPRASSPIPIPVRNGAAVDNPAASRSSSFTTAASSTSAVDTTASTSLSVSPAVLKGAVRLPFAPPPPPPVSSPSTFSPPPPPPRQPPSVAASASSGCDSPSTPPPKPMRAQRRTNIVLHIDPAVLALEAARKAPHAASQEDD